MKDVGGGRVERCLKAVLRRRGRRGMCIVICFFLFFFVRDICGGGCHILNNSNRQLVTPPLINPVPIFELGH